MNVFTTDHPLTSQTSWFDARTYPVRSFICRVLLFTLISAPVILVALYYYDRNEIGAEPDPSSDPYMEFVVGGVISIVLGFILSFVIVSAHRLYVRIWKSRSAA